MFRVTQFMKEIVVPTALAPKREPPGPVVIWNLIRRCNLNCMHCYSLSADVDFKGELSTEEVFAVMDDLRRFGVPALILSGGEPLLRPDIFAITRRAGEMGFYVALSTNGTLIGPSNIDAIAEAGYGYVGISLDGIDETHDYFRRHEGAYRASLAALKLCRDRGIKVGVRFTPTMGNARALPALLQLIEDEGIERFYLSHLNYAGRGNTNRGSDAHHEIVRWMMDILFDACWTAVSQGRANDYVTGNNDADGAYLLHWTWVRRHFPARIEHLRAKLAQWGGNSSGINVANIDNLGNVHPDTFWSHHTLGNVRARPFSEIWTDVSDPILAGLKRRPRSIKGRCARCRHFAICGGNTRIRALKLTGDPWAEDPGCYLTDAEIGVSDVAAAE